MRPSLVESCLRRFHNSMRRVEVRFSDFQVNDTAAAGFEGFGFHQHIEGRFHLNQPHSFCKVHDLIFVWRPI
jgi:hypothetical protein